MVNQTRLSDANAVPMALFALEVQRGSIPGAPGELDKLILPVSKYFKRASGFVPTKAQEELAISYCTLTLAALIGSIRSEFRDKEDTYDHQRTPGEAGNAGRMLRKSDPPEMVEENRKHQLPGDDEANQGTSAQSGSKQNSSR